MHSSNHTNNLPDKMAVWHRRRMHRAEGFADRFKLALRQLCQTQMEACFLLGVSSPSNIRRYVLGEGLPSGSVLAALADLGINVNWLLTGNGSMYSNDTAGMKLREQHAQSKSEAEGVQPSFIEDLAR